MASDIFLKLDGVDGESNDSKHKGEIEILSYSWGLSQPATGSGGSGGGSGKATFQDFHFVSRLQKSSPKLFLACATGEHIKSGIITVRKAGGGSLEFYKITLSDVLVTGLQQAEDAGGQESLPMESISLNFQKIRLDYTQQNAKGSAGQVFSAEFPPTVNTG